MMNNKDRDFLEQMKNISDDFKKNSSILQNDIDLSNAGVIVANSLISRIMSIITRITGTSSEYYKQANDILSKTQIHNAVTRLIRLLGVMSGLHDDIEAGYLKSFSELLHAEIFSDYIEMAEYLLEEGYKDPAAVITGSTLEEHLRKLCIKNVIDIEIKSSGKLRPKKADTINSELAKQGVYTKLDQKNVLAWLDLRNKAAHGEYLEYDHDQVNHMIMGVRLFITKNPA